MHAMNRRQRSRDARHARLGFTLVEILVALSIGLFLMGALLTIVQTNRRVFGEQNQLAQVQDNERMAMTMMGDVIQAAGYFPQPWINTLTTTLTAAAPFGIGTSIYGTYSAAAPGDTIQVRYMTTGQDNIYNCSGGSNLGAPGVNVLYVNAFQVVNGQLVCTMNGTPYTLVGGVAGSGLDITNMSILYGVKANAGSVGNNVDTYMNANQVNAAALWGSVISVQITMTFTNPLAATPGQPATLQFQRVVGVMSQTGPTI
jgi:type IV pilus assembly protein PilW